MHLRIPKLLNMVDAEVPLLASKRKREKASLDYYSGKNNTPYAY